SRPIPGLQSRHRRQALRDMKPKAQIGTVQYRCSIRSHPARKTLLSSASAALSPSYFQTVPLQRPPAVVAQAQFDQFLFQLSWRGVYQRRGQFVQKEYGKPLPRSVHDLPNADGREASAKLGGELFCHFGRTHLGMIGAKAKHGEKGLP